MLTALQQQQQQQLLSCWKETCPQLNSNEFATESWMIDFGKADVMHVALKVAPEDDCEHQFHNYPTFPFGMPENTAAHAAHAAHVSHTNCPGRAQLLPEQQRSAELLHQLEEAESALRESQAAASRLLQQQQACQAEALSLAAHMEGLVAEGEGAEAQHQQEVGVNNCVRVAVGDTAEGSSGLQVRVWEGALCWGRRGGDTNSAAGGGWRNIPSSWG